MDEVIKNVKVRFDHNQNKQILKEKYESKMLFALQGGMWEAGPDLLSTLSVCLDDTAVLTDLYNTPVQINTKDLYNEAQMRWKEQMNAWLVEYEQSSRER